MVVRTASLRASSHFSNQRQDGQRVYPNAFRETHLTGHFCIAVNCFQSHMQPTGSRDAFVGGQAPVSWRRYVRHCGSRMRIGHPAWG
jgi:hypothetical protein